MRFKPVSTDTGRGGWGQLNRKDLRQLSLFTGAHTPQAGRAEGVQRAEGGLGGVPQPHLSLSLWHVQWR